MGNRLTPEEKNAIIENALREYSLAEMPRNLSAEIMARIKRAPEPFKLITWREVTLALVISICLGVMLFSAQSIPPVLISRFRAQEILIYQNWMLNARWLTPAILISIATLLPLAAIPYLRKQ